MKFDIGIDGMPERIEILSPAPECHFRLGETAERTADVNMPEPGVYSVALDGRIYEARIEENPDHLAVVIDGFRFAIEVRDPRRMVRRSGVHGREGVETVAAPMPGKVVRVMVAAGDAVEAGQGLAVVEAMKMQNEMKAPRAGRVTAVPAREGATVAAGDALVVIE
jgi:biotin carboxyl carrier protein